MPAEPHVVVVGGGFAGLQTVRHLRDAPVQVTLVDRQNFHLFQPLAYQVATGALSAPEIATPLRQILRRQRNVRVVMAEVEGFDVEQRTVRLGQVPSGGEETLDYDLLVVAGGSAYSYFGHEEWRPFAPELKSLDGALDLRSRILGAFEAAELERDPELRSAWLTFVVVGAGPTGVEMAGQIGEIANDVLERDFKTIDTKAAKVLLVEAADRVLTSFPPSLSRRAQSALEHLGVTPLLDATVVDIREDAVDVEHGGERKTIPARTVVWAAGVTASFLAGGLASAAGAETDKAGRIVVQPDLTVAGHPELFAIGDMASVLGPDGQPQKLPGVAPVAMQEGRHVAASIRSGQRTPFHYRDKGNLATIGRARAVADVKGVHLSGWLAWVTWLGVHIFYLIGFQNRVLVLLRWTFSYLTRGRGARVIHGG